MVNMRKSDFKYLGYNEQYCDYLFDVKGSSLKEICKLCGSEDVVAVGYDDEENTTYIYGVENQEQITVLTEFMSKLFSNNYYDENQKVELIDVIKKKKGITGI